MALVQNKLSVSDLKTASVVAKGAGSGNPLVGRAIPTLIQNRMCDLEWYTALWKGDGLIQTAAAAGMNRHFLLAGTNADNADVSHAVTAGIGSAMIMETDGATNDSEVAHAIMTTALGSVAGAWDTDQQPGLVVTFVTGTAVQSVTDTRIHVGLKLDQTEDDALVDADQAIWTYDATAAPTWRARTSNNGQDHDFDTGQAPAINTVHQLGVFLDVGRRPHYFFNGVLSHVGPAVRSLATMEPGFSIADIGAGAAKRLYIRNAFTCVRYFTD